MAENPDFEQLARKFLLEQSERVTALRSKEREFHGLEREFGYLQADMLARFQKSKDVKHPRDVGNAREGILKEFLVESGYLPKRFAVSDTSVRVVSTSGHSSREIDILLYDPVDAICLMNREDQFKVFPVESAFGVVQVKSRLNKSEISDGLENIASFKRLARKGALSDQPEKRGFGLLFAYDTDLEWKKLLDCIESFSREHHPSEWCNGVFVLAKGFILHGEDNSGLILSSGIEGIRNLSMFGSPDRQNLCLYQFYSVLLELLRSTAIGIPRPEAYFRLPHVAQSRSYEFQFGMIAELGNCAEHGDFLRQISPANLQKVVTFCKKTQPINWIKATDIAYGTPERPEAYQRQPGDVFIYNPDNLPLPSILVSADPSKGLTFDSIVTEEMVIYIPHFYSEREGIIEGCPKCEKAAKKKTAEDQSGAAASNGAA